MKKISLIFVLVFWAFSASAITVTLHFNDSSIDSVQFDENSQIYFYDPDISVTRLQSPANAAIDVPQFTEFSWQHIPDRDVELLISESDDFVDTTFHHTGIDTNSFRLPEPLDVQKRYYWKVRIEGESLWTAAWYFDTYMPALPEIISSIALCPPNFADQVEFKAVYDSEIDSFLVVYSMDGINFPDTCYSSVVIPEIYGLVTDSLYYLKIAGVNAAGIGPFSEVLALTASVTQEYVLIVNAYDRARTGNTKDFVRQHASAVQELGISILSASNEALTDSLIDLEMISSVIYILGEESTADETFSNDEQDMIEEYLNNGGELFVSGAEIAWDLDYKGSVADKAFCHDYLHIEYKQDAPNGTIGTYYDVEVLGDTIFSDLSSFSFDNGTYGTYNVRYPDVFTPMNDARTFLKYTGCNTGAAGIVYQGMFPGGSSEGKIMVLGFPFETVYPEAARNAIMRDFFQFAEQGLDVLDIAIPAEHRLLPNYPNPFNPKTVISYQISETSEIDIVIFDLNGRKIETLVDKIESAGTYEFIWDAGDLATGIYFVVFRVDGGIVDTRKMTLVK